MRNSINILVALTISILSCNHESNLNKDEKTIARDLPDTSYVNSPVAKFDTLNNVIQLKHMLEFYDVPGEFGYIAEGKDYGFQSLSFILTNTEPNGGPPLHTHDSEEAHIFYEGSVLYTIGGKTFTANGPCIIKIPAGIPHTFLNIGKKQLHLIGAFPTDTSTYTELGRNPLIKDTSVYRKK